MFFAEDNCNLKKINFTLFNYVFWASILEQLKDDSGFLDSV